MGMLSDAFSLISFVHCVNKDKMNIKKKRQVFKHEKLRKYSKMKHENLGPCTREGGGRLKYVMGW